MNAIVQAAEDLADVVIVSSGPADLKRFDPLLIASFIEIILALIEMIRDRCDDPKEAAKLCNRRRCGIAKRIVTRQVRRTLGKDESRRFVRRVATELVEMGCSASNIEEAMRDVP